MKIIDLFSGAGGFSEGFKKIGFKIVESVEYISDMANTYKKNNPKTNVLNIDIKNYTPLKKVNGVLGGPPCQGFSMAGNRVRNGFVDDPRNYLFKEYIRIIKQVQPDFFVMENVVGIKTMKNGEIFKEIISSLSKLKNNNQNYKISWTILKAEEFGVPQKRRRLIIYGNIFNQDIKDIAKYKSKNIVTFNEAIKDIKYNDISEKEFTLNTKQKISNARKGKNIETSSIFSGAYKVIEKNKPTMTITTRYDAPSAGRYIHPDFNRTINDIEAAAIQSFPRNFKFVGTKTNIRKMIGNAVPPKLALAIAKLVKENYE